MRNGHGLTAALLAAASLALGATPAFGAFPGGKRWIVFSRCRDVSCGTAELLRTDANGSNEVILVAHDPVSDDATYSADGKRLVYRQCRAGAGCGLATHFDAAITSNPAGGDSDDYPAFSPDGNWIAFQRCPVSAPCAIWAINVDGSNARQLTFPAGTESDNSPAVSPDGSRIAFQHCPAAGGCEIDVINTVGSGRRALTARAAGQDDDAPNWAPDGAKIAFQRCCDANGHSQVFVIGADGSAPTAITVPDASSGDGEPAFSPDGLLIAFERTPASSGVGRISVVGAAGGAVTALSSGGLWGDYKPDWQPTAPVFTSTPSILGRALAGQDLTVVPGSTLGGGTTTFQWYSCDGFGRDCYPYTGATSATFTIRPTLIGRTFKVIQTQQTAAGRTTSSSPLTAAVTPNPARCSTIFDATNLDTQKGTAGGDVITGGSGSNAIHGLEGDDCIDGGAGDDRIFGGPGVDQLKGGPGDDRISGGDGRDVISGGSGSDLITGDGGRNSISGGSGNDRIGAANRQRDAVNCGAGRDSVQADRFDKLRGCEHVRIVGRRR
jgi:Tol biopolymer transport system component